MKTISKNIAILILIFQFAGFMAVDFDSINIRSCCKVKEIPESCCKVEKSSEMDHCGMSKQKSSKESRFCTCDHLDYYYEGIVHSVSINFYSVDLIVELNLDIINSRKFNKSLSDVIIIDYHAPPIFLVDSSFLI